MVISTDDSFGLFNVETDCTVEEGMRVKFGVAFSFTLISSIFIVASISPEFR